MATAPRSADPRVKRTRRLLQQAFFEILQEKSFTSISIQDITERATVNRGTFYAHFADKYALMDSIVREQFQQVISNKLPATACWNKRSLCLLIQAVGGYLQDMEGHCRPLGGMDPLFERAVQEEICHVLLSWLKTVPTTRASWPVPIESIALVVSWAIFGAAVDWSQGVKPLSAERMANDVLLVLTEGLTRLTPGAVLEK